VNQKEVYDFRLWQATSTSVAVGFSDVFVQIRQNDRVLFSTTSPMRTVNYPSVVFVPQVLGQMSMDVRYELDGKTLAETQIPIDVVNPNDVSKTIGGVTFAVVASALLAIVYRRYFSAAARKRSHTG
jgi:hypothetical protein